MICHFAVIFQYSNPRVRTARLYRHDMRVLFQCKLQTNVRTKQRNIKETKTSDTMIHNEAVTPLRENNHGKRVVVLFCYIQCYCTYGTYFTKPLSRSFSDSHGVNNRFLVDVLDILVRKNCSTAMHFVTSCLLFVC